MNWYKTLDIDQRINLKELCEAIGGIKYQSIIKILGFRLTIETLHQKLKLEGFNV